MSHCTVDNSSSSPATSPSSNPARLALRHHKNLGLVHGILLQIKTTNKVTRGGVIDTRQLAQIIINSGLDSKWNRSSNRADEHGITRVLSDLLGGHGLHLHKIGKCKYEMPLELPTMEGDSVISEAKYA